MHQAQPGGCGAGGKINGNEARARLRPLVRQALVERQALEGLVVARLGEADDGMAADEGEAARIAGAERHRLEASRRRIKRAEFALARIEQPQLAIMEPRRMRHRQARGHDLVRGHIDDDAAIGALFAPAVGHIGARDGRDEGGPASVHGEAVEMAAVLRQELGNKTRLPKRLEACRLADRGEAGKGGVDEDRPSIGPHADVMDIQRARHPALARLEAAGGALVRRRPRRKPIAKTPEHGFAAHPQALAIGPQALAMLDQPLMAANAAIRLAADEHQPSRLIGGKRQRPANPGKPIGKPRRKHHERRLGRGGRFGGHGRVLLRVIEEGEGDYGKRRAAFPFSRLPS